MALHLPSPPVNGFHAGPAFIHFYGLMYVIGITTAILITQRRWKAQGGDPALVGEVALWAVPAGIIGGGGGSRLRLNMYVAGAVALAGAAWFWRTQRRAVGGTPGPAAAQAQPASASHHRP